MVEDLEGTGKYCGKIGTGLWMSSYPDCEAVTEEEEEMAEKLEEVPEASEAEVAKAIYYRKN